MIRENVSQTINMVKIRPRQVEVLIVIDAAEASLPSGPY
jgi:hypothetical protein